MRSWPSSRSAGTPSVCPSAPAHRRHHCRSGSRPQHPGMSNYRLHRAIRTFVSLSILPFSKTTQSLPVLKPEASAVSGKWGMPSKPFLQVGIGGCSRSSCRRGTVGSRTKSTRKLTFLGAVSWWARVDYASRAAKNSLIGARFCAVFSDSAAAVLIHPCSAL